MAGIQNSGIKRILIIFGSASTVILLLIFGEVHYRYPDLFKMKCNGHAQLCDRRVNEVAFATTHNSMSIADYGWFGPSHEHSVTHQLESGIRGFLIDAHYFDAVASLSSYVPNATPAEVAAMERVSDGIGIEKQDGVFFCHITCQLGYTPMNDTLTEYRHFLDDNRHEVLVMIIEDKISAADTSQAFQAAGLDRYLHIHQEGEEWPTLGEMIRNNQRLIVMAEVAGPPPDWYLHAWDYTEETPYAYDSPEQLANVDYSCQPNRGGTDKPFFLLNNWVERVVPLRSDAEKVNDFDFLYRRASECEQQRDQLPNLIAVNFSDYGDVVAVTDALNGVISLSDF